MSFILYVYRFIALHYKLQEIGFNYMISYLDDRGDVFTGNFLKQMILEYRHKNIFISSGNQQNKGKLEVFI